MYLFFLQREGNGGYGDQLVGLCTAQTISRIFKLKLRIVSTSRNYVDTFRDVEYVEDIKHEICDKEVVHYRWIDLGGKKEVRNIIHNWTCDTFNGRNMILECNQHYDIYCFNIDWMKNVINCSFEENLKFNCSQFYNNILIPVTKINNSFDVGIQIREDDQKIFIDNNIIDDNSSETLNIILKYLSTIGKFNSLYITSSREKMTHEMKKLIEQNFENVNVYSNSCGENFHTDKKINNEGFKHTIESHQLLSNCDYYIVSGHSNFGIMASNFSLSKKETRDKPYLIKKGEHGVLLINNMITKHDMVLDFY